MDDDPELQAIRARLRQEILDHAASPATPPAPPVLDRPVDLDEAGLQAFLGEHRLAVVDCWAPWCGPCRIVGPIVEELARSYAGRIAFAKVNVDENPGLSAAFGIQGIPTLLLFRDGRLVDRIVGALPKPHLAAHLQRVLLGRPGPPGPRRA